MKKLLTIAGSDSSGGAGIQADMKTFSAHGCYAMSVITAITAQNTVAVKDVMDVPPEMVKAQMDAVFEDVFPDGVKVGMVSAIATIATIAEGLKKYSPKILVVDPVMVSKSGYHLLRPEAVETLRTELLPLADLITPNIPEAEILCGFAIESKKDMLKAAEEMIKNGCKAVLLKGGHRTEDADDLVFDGEVFHWLPGKRIKTQNTHGTGCTISSAITANLAKGYPLPEAVRLAKEYITMAIEHALAIGSGCGPTHHFYQLWKKAGMAE